MHIFIIEVSKCIDAPIIEIKISITFLKAIMGVVQLSISFCIMRKLYMEEKRNIFCGFRLTCNVETRFTNEKSNVNRIRKKSLSLFIYL